MIVVLRVPVSASTVADVRFSNDPTVKEVESLIQHLLVLRDISAAAASTVANPAPRAVEE